jgi:hypothetical protein
LIAIPRFARALACAAAVVVSASAVSTQSSARTVVIAELFTSEGCSSCPPADDLLRRLIATQPLQGVEIVALGNHVDYWDDLGWRDPFSSALFSKRQAEYEAAVFRSKGAYTPQLVVDGTLEAVGSDEDAVGRSLLKAASLPKITVSVVARQEGDARARVDVHIDVPAGLPPHRTADVVVAVTEDELSSHVTRGENRGRTLSHTAVVRSLTTAGRLKADEHAASATIAVPLAPDWKLPNLRVVAFVQEQASRRILGGGSSPLRRDQP